MLVKLLFAVQLVAIVCLAGCQKRSATSQDSMIEQSATGGPSPVVVRFLVEDNPLVEIEALAFYIFNPTFILENGQQVEAHLDASKAWQSDDVSLIRLHCPQPQGCGHNLVLQRALTQSVAGVSFSVGVPFELNHANPLTLEPPLNNDSMFWVWQQGHKFLRVDLRLTQNALTLAAQNEGARLRTLGGAFHLGSTGCSAPSIMRAPTHACSHPNILRYSFPRFNPAEQVLRVRLSTFLPSALQSQAAEKYTDASAERLRWPNCSGNYWQNVFCAEVMEQLGLKPEGENEKTAGAREQVSIRADLTQGALGLFKVELAP